MRCPQCGSDVPDDTSICPECDFILDKSFLGDDFTDDGDGDVLEPDAVVEDEGAGAEGGGTYRGPQPASAGEDPTRPRPHRRVSRFVAGKPGMDDDDLDEEGVRPVAPPDADADDEVERQLVELRARRQAVDPAAVTAPKAQEPQNLKAEAERISKDIESVFTKYWNLFRTLSIPDRLSVGGGLGLLIFSFFPWVNVERQGPIVGLEVGGLFTVILGACAVALIVIRRDPHWAERVRPVLFSQLAVAGLALLFTLFKMGTIATVKVYDPLSETDQIVPAQVSFGLLFCLLAAAAIAAGSFLVMREVLGKKG